MLNSAIDHPDYYKAGGIEAIDLIEAHGLNFNLGNVIKYVTRAGKKDGEDRLTALCKALWYLEREVGKEANKNDPRADIDDDNDVQEVSPSL